MCDLLAAVVTWRDEVAGRRAAQGLPGGVQCPLLYRAAPAM